MSDEKPPRRLKLVPAPPARATPPTPTTATTMTLGPGPVARRLVIPWVCQACKWSPGEKPLSDPEGNGPPRCPKCKAPNEKRPAR